jgi:allantoinase
MNSSLRVLKNVFVSTGKNSLQLVDIYFDTQIKKIIPVAGSKVEWEEIKTPVLREQFLRGLPTNEIQNNIEEIAGEFKLLIPGGIDPHVHFDTPGFEYREDFEHGSLAAAWGGTTTILDMPCTSIPPVTSKQNFKIKSQSVSGRSYIDYGFWGGVRGNDFDTENDIKKQIQELAETGVIGFKAYLKSGMDSFTDLTLEQMRKASQWIKEVKLPLAVHAEDKELIDFRESRAISMENYGWIDYCRSRDVQAEAEAVGNMIDIAKITKGKIHIVHLSSEFGLKLVGKAQEIGLKFTAETCPHYLFFTQEDFRNSNISNYLKTAPPVKRGNDRDALWRGLKDNILSFVTTDHAGCDPEKEKSSENFWEVYGGIPGVEHRLPFLFSEGFKKNKLNLEQTINLSSTNAAKYFNLKNKGELRKGYDADFALVNLWESEIIKSENMRSLGKYTPFNNVTFYVKLEKTFSGGKLIIDKLNDFISEEKPGQMITV